MQSRGHVLRAENIPSYDGDVLFRVPIVPKSNDAELAEARREISHRLDADARFRRANALAIVVLIANHQVFEPVDFHLHTLAQGRKGRTRTTRPARAILAA
ncbi:MAG: hypothetical protein BMS9Abin37_1824 [Acidobacteriota bacterium]|nr:MAG: hypothetical protein BMS9Abin37_1824 [Acidobacteriota bacterium]